MKKINLLKISVIICKSIRVMLITTFILFTVFFIHFQTNPKYYKNLNSKDSTVKINKSSTTKITLFRESFNLSELNNISKTALYVNYIKLAAVYFFIFLATKEFEKVMQSVKNLKTFQNNNVTSFRKIGKYIFYIFLITSFINIDLKKGGSSGINLNFELLIWMLLVYILAEVFKEGNNLQQENNLTI